MKLLATIICALWLNAGFAQTNLISVNVADFGIAPKALPVTMHLIYPNPRTYNNLLISQAPVTINTGTNGIGYFTNIIWGQYRVDINGTPVTKFQVIVGTNSTGPIGLASLVANPQTLPPNPATNYYTQAQVDAIVANLPAGSGSSGWTSSDRSIYPNGADTSGSGWVSSSSTIYPE